MTNVVNILIKKRIFITKNVINYIIHALYIYTILDVCLGNGLISKMSIFDIVHIEKLDQNPIYLQQKGQNTPIIKPLVSLSII